MLNKVCLSASALFGALLIAGSLQWMSCSNSTNPGSNGTVKMYMADSPASYDSVVVFVTRVEVHTGSDSSSGWSVVRGDSARFDLLVLRNGARAVLGSNGVVAGHYSQIRLIVGAGSYVVDGGVKHELVIPSGMETGIKLNHDFDIETGQTFELLLDFDAARSIHVTGNGKYMMNPVIRVSEVAATGSITGVIVPATANTTVWTNVGDDTVSTVADNVTGVFSLSGLNDGTFAIHCEPGNALFRDTVLSGIVVIKLQQTAVGTVALRLF